MSAASTAKSANQNAEEKVHLIPIDLIDPDPHNGPLDQAVVDDIANSLPHTEGLIHPILVEPKPDGRYTVAAGHHRLAAVKQVGGTEIKATIKADGVAIPLIRMIENNIRRDMTWSQKVETIRQWKTLKPEDTPDDIYQKLSIHKRMAAEMMLVAELPQEYIAKADTNPPLKKNMLAFARLPQERRALIAKKVVEYHEQKKAYPGAPDLEAIVKSFTLGIKAAPFDINPCLTCPSNSNCQAGLFADDGQPEDGTCSNMDCYKGKMEAARLAAAHTAGDEHEIPEERYRVFTGKDDIYVEPVVIDDETHSPWKAQDLLDTAVGCKGCDKQCVVTQRRSTRFVAIVSCTDSKCYSDMMPKDIEPSPASSQPTSTTTSGKVQPRKGKGKGASAGKDATKATFKPEFGSSKAIGKYRRKAIISAITTKVDASSPQAVIRSLLHAVKDTGIRASYAKYERNQIADFDDAAMLGAIKDFIKGIAEQASDVTTQGLFVTLVDEDFYRTSTSLNDVEFLNTLTRAELLGMLDEAGYSAENENGWKDAMKKSKGDLVKFVTAFKFADTFLPKTMIPQNPRDFAIVA